MKRKFLAWLMTLAMMVNMVAPYAAYADELPVGDDTYVSADGTDVNNDDESYDVEGEPTVGEPSTDDEQPAVGDSDEEPADEQPVDGNDNNAESDGKEVVDEQPAADEKPVTDEQPAEDEEPVEDPALGDVAGILENFAAQALQTGIMPVAEAGTVQLTLISDGSATGTMTDVKELKLYTYDKSTGAKGTDNLLTAKTNGDVVVNVAPGTYWLEGYHMQTKNLLGGTSITVGEEPVTYTVKYFNNIKASNSGWVAGTDYSVKLKATSSTGEERVVEPVLATATDKANTAGTYSCIFIWGDTVTATFETSKEVETAKITASATPTNEYQFVYNGTSEKLTAEFVLLHNMVVTAPEGSTITVGRMLNYMIYKFQDPVSEPVTEKGTVTATYKLPEAIGSNIWQGRLESHFVRVQHPDGVTYWTGAKYNADTTINVTAEQLQIGSTKWKKDTVVNDFSVSKNDVGNLYLVANAQGCWQMKTGDTKELNVHRNWQVVDSYWPSVTALPDMHYQVVDFEGNPSDVVTVTPTTKYNDSQVNIKANKKGTAIVLVTYDAVRFAQAYDGDGSGTDTGDLTFSATWPELTGVLVVDVDGNDKVTANTNIYRPKTDKTEPLDSELDILFYTGDDGATYSFTPESGCTVSVARSAVKNGKLTFSGFEAVTADEDGQFNVTGLKDGRHIIKVEKGGAAYYQVVTARQVTCTVYHEEGETPVTAENPAKPAEKVVVQYSRMINPAERLSGAYNFTAAVYLEDEEGNSFQSKDVVPGSTYGSYVFSSDPSYQRVTVTIPRYIATNSYELTGSLFEGGFGSNPGGHRSDLMHFNAVRPSGSSPGAGGEISAISELSIPVKPTEMAERTLILHNDATDEVIADTSKLTIKLTDADGEAIKLSEDNKFTMPAGTYKYDISGVGVARAQGSFELDKTTAEVIIKVTVTSAEAWGGNAAGVEPKQQDGVYLIGTGDELAWFSAKQNAGKTALSGKLTADINLSNYDWNNTNNNIYPNVATVFDGDGHTVSGLNAKYGLFAVVGTNSKISNLTVSGTSGSAGVVGRTNGIAEFENVTSNVKITLTGGNVGGIVGNAGGSITIKNCVNKGDIVQNDATVIANNVGGIIGMTKQNDTAVITNCLNEGNVTGTQFVGGIVGSISTNKDVEISGCINKGNVSGKTYVGGIAGQGFGKIVLKDCYNTGEINKTSSLAGGIAGGLGGYGSYGTADATKPATANNCYSTGKTNDKALFGELGGWSSTGNSFANNCVYLKGDVSDANGTELTEEQLKEWAPANSAIKPVCGATRYPALIWETGVKFHSTAGSGTVTAATCTADGYTEYTCDNCTKTYRDNYVDALGHSWCDDDGTGNCKDCIYTAAKCTADGSHVRTCKREGCNETNTTVIKATGHKYCDHAASQTCEHCSYTTEPKCTTDGELSRVCQNDNCTETKTDAVAALGHKIKESSKQEHSTYTSGDCERVGCGATNLKIWKSPYFEHMTLPDDLTKAKDFSMNTEVKGWVWNAENQAFENSGTFEKVTFNFTLLKSGTLSFDFGLKQLYGFFDKYNVTLTKGSDSLISETVDTDNYNNYLTKHCEQILTAGTYSLSFELATGINYPYDIVASFKNVTLTVSDEDVSEADITAAQAVMALIDKIDKTITLDSERGITSARSAYDELTDAQKKLVTNLETLTAAEAALQALKDAANAPKSITVYVSYFDEGKFVTGDDSAKTLMYKVPVTLNGTASTTFTMDDAFKALHKSYYTGGEAGYASSGSFVGKFWGVERTTVSFGKNNGWVNSVQTAVADNDTLVFYTYKDSTTYSDLLTWFAKDSYTATAGSDTAFILNGLSLMGSGEVGSAKAKPQGATIKVYNAEGNEVSGMATTTDENGEFKLNFTYNGTYTVVASGTCNYTMSGGYNNGESRTDAPVVPARCTVTVSGGQEAPVGAATPTITTDLSAETVSYTKDATATALTIVATVSDNGTLSYQWQQSANGTDWTNIDNATGASYTPLTTTVGETYYRCVVTNSLSGTTATANSTAAKVAVTAQAGPEQPGQTVEVTFTVSPAAANVLVLDADGNVVSSGKTTMQLAANSTFTYYVGKDGYQAQKGTITTAETAVSKTVTLTAKTLPTFTSAETYNMLIGNMAKMTAFPTNTDEAVLKWCVPVGTNYGAGEPTNPVFVNESLYMIGNVKDQDGSDYCLKKINPADGSVIKKVKLESNANYTYNYFLTTAEDMLFVMVRGKVEAYDIDLNKLWVSEAMPGSQGLCPINYSDGYVYGGTCMSAESVFFCLSAVDGSKIWANKPAVGNGHYWAGGCIVGDYVIYGSDGGRVYAANKYTGEIASTIDVASGKNVRSSIAYDNGKVFFTSVDGYVHSADFDTANGSLSNLKSVLVGTATESGSFGNTTTATPTVYNNRLYVGSSSHFAVFNATTLENIYRAEQTGGTLRDMRLVVDDTDKTVYAFGTYYKTPGAFLMYSDKEGQTTASAAADFGVFMTDETKQYNCAMPVFGPDGTIYATNDKGYLSAYTKASAYLTSLKANVGTFTSEFDKKALKQELTVPVGTTDVTLTFVATDGATISIADKEITTGSYKVALVDEAAVVKINVAKGGSTLTYTVSIRAVHTDAGMSVVISTSNNIEDTTKVITAYEGKDNVFVILGATADERIWLGPTDAKATLSEPQIISGTSKFYDVDSTNVHDGITYPWRTYHSAPVYPLIISADVTAEDGTVKSYYVVALSESSYSGTPAYKLGIKLNKTELALKEGASEALTADVAYLGTEPTVTWTSDNTAVAEVDANGKVTAKGKGTANITAAIDEQIKAVCVVTVSAQGSSGGDGGSSTPTEKTVNVTVNFSKDGELEVHNANLTVSDTDGDKKITMSDAFYVLHEKYNSVNNYAASNGWISKFWGDTSANFSFTQNHKWVSSAAQTISSGDKLDVFIYEDTTEYSDLLTWFAKDSYSGKTGAEITFTVNGMNVFESGEKNKQASAVPVGATVTIYDDKDEEIATTITDDKGQFKLSLPDAGVYTIEVSGTCSYTCKSYSGGTISRTDAPVVPSRCTVSISGQSTGGSIGGATTETKYTATEVIDLIDAIGTVTKDSKSAIEKARAAYDSLIAAQQKKVTNYDKLTAAEKKYTELTGEKIEVASDLPFSDVKSGAWYYDAIKKMYDKGLMNGESEKQFMPNNKLSRAMLVTILYRLAEQPEVSADSVFSDVAAGQWYTKAVAWASGKSIVGGVGDGKFAPNDSITRQELAAMLYRYAKAAGLNTTATADLSKFSDSASVADWAVDAMKWAVASGLMKGNDDGTINPTGTATRAEVATVIMRLIEM